MDDYRTEKTEIPVWMCRQENYTPSADKEAFLTRSTKSVLSVLARLRFDEGKDGRFSATPSLKLFYTLLYIVLTACSGNYLFVLIMCVAVTVRLAFFSASAIRQILSGTAGSVMISIFLLLPAVFMGNPQTLANITARVTGSKPFSKKDGFFITRKRRRSCLLNIKSIVCLPDRRRSAYR